MKYTSAHIVYASASGNTQYVAENVYLAVSKIVDTKLEKADNPKLKFEFDSNRLQIFAVSTWEHGEINPQFNPVVDIIKDSNLEGVNGAFIGLGDLRYEPILFCGGMEALRGVFKDSSGIEIISPMKIDGEPRKQESTIIKKWISNLLDLIKEGNE